VDTAAQLEAVWCIVNIAAGQSHQTKGVAVGPMPLTFVDSLKAAIGRIAHVYNIDQ
jgi:hypothetical protein